MRIALITAAGISSRFNEGVEENQKRLKAIYTDGDASHTLLARLTDKCSYADRIIVVGGYKYDELKQYVRTKLPAEIRKKIILIYNEFYRELASGYSLYLGLEEAFRHPDLEEILFAEGDLDMDRDSFEAVINLEGTVLTCSYKPIEASRDVVLYRDDKGSYRYIFNCSHGCLKIDDYFSCIYNSGQIWKFADMEALKEANRIFGSGEKDGANLKIIQEYINRIPQEKITVAGLQRWTNCNTRQDYMRIKKGWI